MKRVDADDFALPADLFREADESAAGAFAASSIDPTKMERVVAEVIWRRRGRANAVAIATLTKMFSRDERTIKGIVEQLVTTHRMRIGGARNGDVVGYFMIEDAGDLEAAVGPYRSQIFAMWRRLRVLLEPRALREMHGQLVIDQEKE